MKEALEAEGLGQLIAHSPILGASGTAAVMRDLRLGVFVEPLAGGVDFVWV